MPDSKIAFPKQIIRAAILRVKGNVLLSGDICLQIKNIAQISHGEAEKRVFPAQPFFLLISVGLLGIALEPFINKSSLYLLETVVIIGAIILIVSFIRQSPTHGVHIVMNTGTTFIFTSKHSSFVPTAYEALCKYIDQLGKGSEVLLDFGKGTIGGGSEITIEVEMEITI